MSNAISITEALALAETGGIVLKRVQNKGEIAKKVPFRYFWNKTSGGRGGLQIRVGDAGKPRDQQPFLLVTPSKFKGTNPKDQGVGNALGAFTCIPDLEEAKAWNDFYEWMLKQVASFPELCEDFDKDEKGCAVINKSFRKFVACPLKFPKEDSELKGICISQKIMAMPPGDGKESLNTIFRFLEEDGVDEDGKTQYDLGDVYDISILGPSSTVISVVELSELRKTPQDKLGVSLYVRYMFTYPASSSSANTMVRIGGRILDVSAAPKKRTSLDAGDADAEATGFTKKRPYGAGARAGAGAGAGIGRYEEEEAEFGEEYDPYAAYEANVRSLSVRAHEEEDGEAAAGGADDDASPPPQVPAPAPVTVPALKGAGAPAGKKGGAVGGGKAAAPSKKPIKTAGGVVPVPNLADELA
jgi:hypothetical protein